MEDANHQSPSLGTLLGRIGRTSLGTLRNRAELLSVEWQEEKERLSNLLVLSLGLAFLAILTIGLVIGTLVVILPAEYRVYALGGSAVLCGGGGAWAWIKVKSLLKKTPFAESIDQVRKDTHWLERTE